MGNEGNESPFAEFINTLIGEKKWSNRDFAEKAQVSFRAIGEARSGALEKVLRTDNLSSRKRLGVSGSTYRILLALGQDPKTWMDKLGLQIPNPEALDGSSFESKLRLILEDPLTAEDIEQFMRLQKELQDLFSIEMALRLLMRKRLET